MEERWSGTPAIGNTIDFITIATTGDAVDFGDTTLTWDTPQVALTVMEV